MASSGSEPPAGYEARPAILGDLPAIDDVFVSSERVFGVRPDPRSGYLRFRWSQPYVDIERDTRVVTHERRPVAFGMAFIEESMPTVSRCMGRVHPDHVGRGLGSWLLAFFEEHARAAERVVTCRAGIEETDAAGHGLVTRRGYRRVRTSFDMGTSLEGSHRAGAPPLGVTIRPFAAGEEHMVWRLEVEAFRDHWDHESEQSFEAFHGDWFDDPGSPPSVLIAELDDRPVGEIAWIVDHGVPYVFSVGVLRDARGRGIATALLDHAMADAAAQGSHEMTLSVDAASPTGAVRVYEKVGMRVLRSTAIYDKDIT